MNLFGTETRTRTGTEVLSSRWNWNRNPLMKINLELEPRTELLEKSKGFTLLLNLRDHRIGIQIRLCLFIFSSPCDY